MEVNIAQLIEDLSIANSKLYEICNMKAKISVNPGEYSKEEVVGVLQKDIDLCKRRGDLKNKINEFFGQKSVEVKQYGD